MVAVALKAHWEAKHWVPLLELDEELEDEELDEELDELFAKFALAMQLPFTINDPMDWFELLLRVQLPEIIAQFIKVLPRFAPATIWFVDPFNTVFEQVALHGPLQHTVPWFNGFACKVKV